MANPENKFSTELVKTFVGNGVFSIKTADRFKHGLADIYAKGGNWIECKQLEYIGQRAIILLPRIKETQVDFLMRAEIGGDHPYVAIQFKDGAGRKSFFILQWHAFRHIRSYTPEMHDRLAVSYGNRKAVVNETIDGHWINIWHRHYADWFKNGWIVETDPCARYYAALEASRSTVE